MWNRTQFLLSDAIKMGPYDIFGELYIKLPYKLQWRTSIYSLLHKREGIKVTWGLVQIAQWRLQTLFKMFLFNSLPIDYFYNPSKLKIKAVSLWRHGNTNDILVLLSCIFVFIYALLYFHVQSSTCLLYQAVYLIITGGLRILIGPRENLLPARLRNSL